MTQAKEALTREDLTKRVALQLQMALTDWSELFPEDTDEIACSRSLELVENDLEEILTAPEQSVTTVEEPSSEPDEKPSEEASQGEPRQATGSFRDLLLDLGRAHPRGFDITTMVREAEATGWTHENPRVYVSLAASQLVRSGMLIRKERGIYALSSAYL